MSSILTSALSNDRKGDLATCIAAQIRASVQANPGRPIDNRMVLEAITAFECGPAADAVHRKVAILTRPEVDDLEHAANACDAVVSQVQKQLPGKLQNRMGGVMAADPELAVSVLVEDNKQLRAEIHNSKIITDMHKELVNSLKELIPLLAKSEAAKPHLQAAQQLLARAEAAGSAAVPRHITPFDMLRTVERLMEVNEKALMSYHRAMDRDDVARGISAVSDAVRLLEQIHGPSVVVEEDDEGDRTGENY